MALDLVLVCERSGAAINRRSRASGDQIGIREWITTRRPFSVAAGLVYREGLAYFHEVPESRLADLAISYVLRDRTNREVVLEVQRSGLASAPEIARLMQIGRTRAALKRGHST